MKALRALADRLGAALAALLGALALLLGWIGISSTGYVSEQLPYIISGGLVGIFLLGLGGVLWLSADLRDDWRKLDALDERMASLQETIAAANDRSGDDGQLAAVADLEPPTSELPVPLASRRRSSASASRQPRGANV